MATDVAVPVESSTPAAEPTVVPNFEPSTYTESQRDAWIEKGTIPTMEQVAEAESKEGEAEDKTSVVAESTPEEEEDNEVVNAAEATPVKKGTQQPEAHGKGKGADARKEQLNAEIRDLAAKRKAADQEYADLLSKIDKAKKDVPAESSAAPVNEAKPQKPEKPGKKPEFGDIDGETGEQFEAREAAYEEKREKYVEDLVAYRLAEERYAEAERKKQDEIKAFNKRVEDQWNQRVGEAAEKVGLSVEDFKKTVFTEAVPLNNLIDGFCLRSTVGPLIVHYLSNNLDEAREIVAMEPYEAASALRDIEIYLGVAPRNRTKVEPAKPEAEAAPEPEKKPVVVPPTKAKKPPTEIRAVNGAPPDDVKAAIAADDVSRFMALRNAQDVAKHKRG